MIIINNIIIIINLKRTNEDFACANRSIGTIRVHTERAVSTRVRHAHMN